MTARSPFAMALRRTFVAAAPVTGMAALTVIASGSLDPLVDRGARAAAASHLLEFAVLVGAIAIAIAAVRLWPMFAVSAAGRDWLRRLQPTPLHGCGAVIAGALLAQLLLIYPIALLLPLAYGAPGKPLARTVPRAEVQAPLLTPASPRLAFTNLPAGAVATLELRPLAAMPAGALRTSRVQVRADGEPLGEPMGFEESGQRAELVFSPRTIARLELELVDGNVPLFFAPECLWVIEAEPRSAAANAFTATLACAVPTFVALAFACLCGAVAAAPTVLTVVGTIQFLFLIGGVGPAAPALQQLLRGQWLAPADIFAAGAPSVGAGVLAMILAMLLHRRHAS